MPLARYSLGLPAIRYHTDNCWVPQQEYFAFRMAKNTRAKTSVKIDVEVHPRLEELQKSLVGVDLPNYIDQSDIVSALVLFAIPEQLDGLLRGYWRQIGAGSEDDADG
jgi:hypothetical protein